METENIFYDESDSDRFIVLDEQRVSLEYSPEEIAEQIAVATNFFRALYAIRSKKEKLAAQKKDMLEWFDNQEKALNQNEAYVENKLFLAADINEDAGGGKSIKTHRGTVSIRTTTGVHIDADNDDPRVIAYAERNGLEIKVKKTVSKSDLKKSVATLDPKPEWAEVRTTRTHSIRLN